jgi:cation diffusion facilitator CzcD-associated flavoprotein CzcO
VKSNNPTVVIGAGPYGLSIAAYLQAQGVPTLVFGKPMESWHNMPDGMYLKSVWSASTFFDPAGKYSLNRYIASTDAVRQEPIPLSLFLNYAHWFQQHAVTHVDPTYVQSLASDGKQFHLDLVDGRTVKASKVVVAAGIASFAYIPDFAQHLPITLASHTQFHKDFSGFKGRRVAVLGSGQSGLESAALLHEAGADVELIARSSVTWINRKLYDRTGPAKHIFYPPSDVGPPGLNWLVSFPLVFRRFPDKARQVMDKRAVRPAGAQWLQQRVEGQVRLTASTHIVKATVQGRVLCLELSDGTTREVDHLLLGTGYRPNIDKLAFIDPALRQQVQCYNGYPLQNKWFESSVPNLYFVGALAGHTFGPICRFVAGSKVAAQQIARHAAQAA